MGSDNNIQMVDLKGQYLKIEQEIDRAIKEVILSSQFVKGGKVTAFEEHLSAYLNSTVITCGNGTDALQMALMATGLNEGDEIITTPFTFIATLEVIALLKLKPVLVDVDPDSFNINPRLIAQHITARTKAIIPVHLFGQCAHMEQIMQIAQKHNLYVIEDACQALGTDYIHSNGERQKAGTIGHIGCNSFFPSKNLGAYGDGGALFTSDEQLAKQLRIIANHGMERRYYHDYIGVNSRLDAIQAAILDVKLRYLDRYTKARNNAADFYDEQFADCSFIDTPYRVPYSTHCFHQYTLKAKNINRDSFRDFLLSKEVPAMIYYPVPLHLQKAYAYLGYQKGDFPVTERLSETVISLPMHTELSATQLHYITKTVKSYTE